MRKSLSGMARPEGLEPPTRGLEIRRSVLLSYGRNSLQILRLQVKIADLPGLGVQTVSDLSLAGRRTLAAILGEMREIDARRFPSTQDATSCERHTQET